MSMAITLNQILGAQSATYLSIIPSIFEMHVSGIQNTPMSALNLSNSVFSQTEYCSTRFPWIVYGFNNGHIFSTMQAYGLLYNIILAADPDSLGRALLHEFGQCQTVVPSIYELLAYLKSSLKFSVTGYMMHSPCTMIHSSHTVFWRTQLTIIEKCRRRRGLHALIIHVHDGSPKHLVHSFFLKPCRTMVGC